MPGNQNEVDGRYTIEQVVIAARRDGIALPNRQPFDAEDTIQTGYVGKWVCPADLHLDIFNFAAVLRKYAACDDCARNGSSRTAATGRVVTPAVAGRCAKIAVVCNDYIGQTEACIAGGIGSPHLYQLRTPVGAAECQLGNPLLAARILPAEAVRKVGRRCTVVVSSKAKVINVQHKHGRTIHIHQCTRYASLTNNPGALAVHNRHGHGSSRHIAAAIRSCESYRSNAQRIATAGIGTIAGSVG